MVECERDGDTVDRFSGNGVVQLDALHAGDGAVVLVVDDFQHQPRSGGDLNRSGDLFAHARLPIAGIAGLDLTHVVATVATVRAAVIARFDCVAAGDERDDHAVATDGDALAGLFFAREPCLDRTVISAAIFAGQVGVVAALVGHDQTIAAHREAHARLAVAHETWLDLAGVVAAVVGLAVAVIAHLVRVDDGVSAVGDGAHSSATSSAGGAARTTYAACCAGPGSPTSASG